MFCVVFSELKAQQFFPSVTCLSDLPHYFSLKQSLFNVSEPDGPSKLPSRHPNLGTTLLPSAYLIHVSTVDMQISAGVDNLVLVGKILLAVGIKLRKKTSGR